jgi:hypothetical protein
MTGELPVLSINSCKTTINLFDVKEWAECGNKIFGFPDKHERTCVTLHDGVMYKVRVSYREFGVLMETFLGEYGALDERTSFKASVKPDKSVYCGMMQTKFSIDDKQIMTAFHRKDYKPADLSDAIYNCLFSNITPMN